MRKIEWLGLMVPVRVANAIEYWNYKRYGGKVKMTLERLLQKNERELLKFLNFGPDSLLHLKIALKNKGLSLAPVRCYACKRILGNELENQDFMRLHKIIENQAKEIERLLEKAAE